MADTATSSAAHRPAPTPTRDPAQDAASEAAPIPRVSVLLPPETKPRAPGRARAQRQALRQGSNLPGPQALLDGAGQAPEQAPPAPPPPVRDAGEVRRTRFPAPAYQLLGAASPAHFVVAGSLKGGAPMALSASRTGVYRPEGVWPAPWAGLPQVGYSDDRTGLLGGTRLLTSRGELAVEQLLVGDLVLGLAGPSLLPVLWIGCSVASAFPVLIAAGALGPDRPRRALRVAAGHLVFVATRPVAAEDLVNGSTIQFLEITAAELFHINVGPAELLLAEGVPVGSAWRPERPAP